MASLADFLTAFNQNRAAAARPAAPTPPAAAAPQSSLATALQQLLGGGGSGNPLGERLAGTMGAGTAPATGSGLMAAGRNAMSVSNPITGVIAGILNKLIGTPGGLQNVPGRQPYDDDLVAMVASARPGTEAAARAEADRIQTARNLARAADTGGRTVGGIPGGANVAAPAAPMGGGGGRGAGPSAGGNRGPGSTGSGSKSFGGPR